MNRLLSDLENIKKRCKDLEKKEVLVGIVGGADSEVIKIATIHEYGSSKHPERSFIRASFDSHQGEIEKIVEKQVTRVLNGLDAKIALNLIGAQCTQITQGYIDNNEVTPKSDYSKKTQHTTLYETGTHIRDRITWKVEDK